METWAQAGDSPMSTAVEAQLSSALSSGRSSDLAPCCFLPRRALKAGLWCLGGSGESLCVVLMGAWGADGVQS